ncbi:MAG TPA: response regulator [Stellaceae bacterium]|nr:response regulator [Stellaceae bacterium]
MLALADPDRKVVCVPRKFLVVDDNQDICEVVAEMLRTTGAQIITAFNGTDALGVLEKGQLDLAIVDLLFAGPVSSEVIVQLAKLKQCPVITMSGTLASDRRGRDLATPHLIKPFGTDQLVNLVEKTLSQRGRSAIVL